VRGEWESSVIHFLAYVAQNNLLIHDFGKIDKKYISNNYQSPPNLLALGKIDPPHR
jgi:hypothetical protein